MTPFEWRGEDGRVSARCTYARRRSADASTAATGRLSAPSARCSASRRPPAPRPALLQPSTPGVEANGSVVRVAGRLARQLARGAWRVGFARPILIGHGASMVARPGHAATLWRCRDLDAACREGQPADVRPALPRRQRALQPSNPRFRPHSRSPRRLALPRPGHRRDQGRLPTPREAVGSDDWRIVKPTFIRAARSAS